MPRLPKKILLPVLVGEANPYGSDPEFALYPSPEGSSGHRLCCRILGMRRTTYLRSFERINLCPQDWVTSDARERAIELQRVVEVRKWVLLGAKVQPCVPCVRNGRTVDGGAGDPGGLPNEASIIRRMSNVPSAGQPAPPPPTRPLIFRRST